MINAELTPGFYTEEHVWHNVQRAPIHLDKTLVGNAMWLVTPVLEKDLVGVMLVALTISHIMARVLTLVQLELGTIMEAVLLIVRTGIRFIINNALLVRYHVLSAV